MYVKKYVDLKTFEFWSGAKTVASILTDAELDKLNDIFEDIYDEDEFIITETELNDIFWFDSDWIAELLGFQDYEELYTDRKNGIPF